MAKKLSVAVLAATGMVGQRYVSMLSNHPLFETVAVTGQTSVGKKYWDVISQFGLPISQEAKTLPVRPTRPEALGAVDLVFSPLPTDVAAKLEPEFAKAGYKVITDASPHRMEKDVPLVVPEVNPSHLDLME